MFSGFRRRGQLGILTRSAQREKRRRLEWRIEDLEQEIERARADADDELETHIMVQRLATLKEQLRRLGGPLDEEEMYL